MAKGRYSARYDPVEVFVSVRTIGLARAARIHRLPRRTIYNALAKVEADDALLGLALAKQASLSARFDAALVELKLSAVHALIADIVSGRATSRDLVALLAAATSSKEPTPLSPEVVHVPAVLATPRMETT